MQAEDKTGRQDGESGQFETEEETKPCSLNVAAVAGFIRFLGWAKCETPL